MHETLDETIDRVAGELSAVPGDPALTPRVRERMDGRRRVWLMPTLAAASVAGVVVLAMAALWPRAEQIEAPDADRRELAAYAVAPFAPLASPQEPVRRNESARPVVDEAVTRSRRWASLSAVALAEAGARPGVQCRTPAPPHPAVPLIDADVEPVGPAPLAIAELTIARLAMPEVAEIEPLRIESLQVAEIELENPKESR